VGDGFARHLKALPPDTPVELAIRMAAEKTNAEVVRESRSGDSETAGMGATLVLAILRGNDAVIAHVGDSRAYLYRNGNLTALTRDHTRGQDKVNEGLLTEEQAWDHPESSVLTRAFGHSDPLTIDISAPIPLKMGDQVLLCSDGLCGYVRDTTIADVLSQRSGAKRTAERLVQLANEAGGEDNVTVQMILVGEEPHGRPAEPTEVEPTKVNLGLAPPRPSRTIRLIALVLVVALVAAAGWGGYELYKHRKAGPVDSARAQQKPPVLSGAAATPASHASPPPVTAAGNDAAMAQAGVAPPVILLLGDDADHSVQKLLGEKWRVEEKLPPNAEQAFSQFPLSVIVDLKAQNPPLDFAKQIHKAMTEKFSTELVELRHMQPTEKKILKPADESIVVVGPKPLKPTKAKAMSNPPKGPDAETTPDGGKKK